jgi:hypothetical protein
VFVSGIGSSSFFNGEPYVLTVEPVHLSDGTRCRRRSDEE